MLIKFLIALNFIFSFVALYFTNFYYAKWKKETSIKTKTEKMLFLSMIFMSLSLIVLYLLCRYAFHLPT